MKEKKPVVFVDWKKAWYGIAGLIIAIVIVIFGYIFYFSKLRH